MKVDAGVAEVGRDLYGHQDWYSNNKGQRGVSVSGGASPPALPAQSNSQIAAHEKADGGRIP